jgi:hypothetical protein
MGFQRRGSLSSFGDTGPMVAACRRTAERVGVVLQARVKHHTPVADPPPGHEAEWLASRKRLPGTLRESWRVGDVQHVGNRQFSVDVYTEDEIAPYVEWPTLPHLIVPRRPGGWLRFWTKEGDTVYARIVHHTGTKGSYMMAIGAAETQQLWHELGVKGLEEWAAEQEALIG